MKFFTGVFNALCIIALALVAIALFGYCNDPQGPPKDLVIQEEPRPGLVLSQDASRPSIHPIAPRLYYDKDRMPESMYYWDGKKEWKLTTVSPATYALLKYCCEPPYPKDWLYCPYCGQDLSTNRRIRKWESIPTWTVSQTCDTCKTVWTYSNIDKPRAQLCPTCPTPEEGEEE